MIFGTWIVMTTAGGFMSQVDTSQGNGERFMRLKAVIQRDLEPYLPQLQESLSRVGQLLSLASILATSPGKINTEHGGPSNKAQAEDILRAAIVLIHSCLEDFLRTLAERILPERDELALKDVALAGLDRGKSQFHLGHLVQHRHKTVDALIRESVSGHLERSTFNNTTEVAHLLERLNLDRESVRGLFPSLDQMMQRRHQIVHRADRVKDPSSDTFKLAAVFASDVTGWLKATRDFTVQVVSELISTAVVRHLSSDAGNGELYSKASK
jgi:hypothetical protein